MAPSDRVTRAPLPVISPESIVVRLRTRLGAGGAIAVDADGTLWSGDIGIDAFTTLLEQRMVREPALAALNEEARLLHLEPLGDANDQAARLYHEFEAGNYPEDRAFAMMAWVLAGYSADEVLEFAVHVIEHKELGARLHGELVPILLWASHENVPIYVVSASPEWLIVPAVEQLRLPVTRVFAMKAAQSDGRMRSRVTGPITYGQGKLTALRAGIGPSPLLAAFGDSPYDLAMLAQAEISVAVRPKPDLVARAAECPNLVELEARGPAGSGYPRA